MKKKNKTLCVNVGERLKTLREEWKLNKKKMAWRIGVLPNNYLRYETGEIFPNPEVQHRLLKVYKISMDWLLHGEGSKYITDKETQQESQNRLAEIKKLEKQLEMVTQQKNTAEHQLKKEQATLASLQEMTEEVKEVVREMSRITLLRYEVLAQYERFKLQNHALIASSPSPEEQKE